jgi:tRNA(fMet)-specific endonuclease VapC
MDEELVLDTNILVHMVRGDQTGQQVKSIYEPLMATPRPSICIVTDGELRSLSAQFEWGEQKSTQALFLLSYFMRINIDAVKILEAYAAIDNYSLRMGRSMGKNDLWIAAAASVKGAILLTTDDDFDHLDGVFLTIRKIK